MSNDTFEVTRKIAMQADPGAILDHIIDFRQWVSWSPWEGIDPALQRTYSGAETGVGATYAWQGNRKVGSGSMRITECEPDHVTSDLQFLKPFKARNTTTISLAADGDSTDVVWSMVGPKTAVSKIMGIFMSMDKMVGKDFEKGLAQLKAIVESS